MRAELLAAIDSDWNRPWPLDWQRHYRVLADLVDADGVLPGIEPGVLSEGDDLGKWLLRMREASTWAQLSAEQRNQGRGKAQRAFQGGLAALAQWVEREGGRPVPRGHSEQVTVEGGTEPMLVKLGVRVSNTRARRGRPTQEQREALRELGIEWA